MDNEKQEQLRPESTPAPINDPPLDSDFGHDRDLLDFCDEHADVEILSELFKGSKEARLDDFVRGNGETAIDVLDVLYGQAVEVAKEMEWPVPSRAEFETQYKQEIEKLRRHDEKD